MATTPSGFWYPTPGDTINSISGLFAQQASSAEQALNNRLLVDGVARFIDAAERNAAYATILPEEGTLTYIQSTGTYEKWNGSTWAEIIDDFPPVTGKNGTVSPLVMLTPGETYYSGTVVSFTQRPNISIIIFGMFVATQAGGAPTKALVRSLVQYQADGGAWTSGMGAAANGYVPDSYAFDISYTGTWIIPGAATKRDINLRAYMTHSLGGAGPRFDYASITAMSFSQTDNL